MKKKINKFGVAFGDFFEISRSKKSHFGADEVRRAEVWGDDLIVEKQTKLSVSSWRKMVIYVGFLIAFLVIFARAFDLQIIKGQSFLNKAEGNRVQLLINHAPRGVIFDRNGKVLAQNIPSFRLVVEPESIPSDKKDKVLSKLASILKRDKKELEKKLSNSKGKSVTLVESLPEDKALLVEAESKDLHGVQVEVRPIREYPFKEITSNILGYTSEADENDLKKELVIPYNLGDQVGKAGVEQSMEKALRGINGYRLLNIDASGEKKGKLYSTEPLPGRSITLSIDIDLQKFVHSVLKKKIGENRVKAGSAVVIDPETGEVLALVSLPSYDNNIFAKGISATTYKNLISNQDKPLINRAIGASYPPGSTFKLVSAAAGLESGTITPETKIVDPGYIILGNQVFRNWLWIDHRRTEGAINIVRALARSTDTFFYRLGQMMGEETLAKYASIIGFGEKTGIELPGETDGLVPTNEWKLKVKGEPWYPGETLNFSIGQGDLLTTPLQISVMTSVFANNGNLIGPTILKTNQAKIKKENIFSKNTISNVQEGMYKNTVGDGGVGWLFIGSKFTSAGKTGTSESGQEAPHAWYTAYAPYPRAEIVVTVMVEHAGHGSEVSAPVVKEIFRWWFANR